MMSRLNNEVIKQQQWNPKIRIIFYILQFFSVAADMSNKLEVILSDVHECSNRLQQMSDPNISDEEFIDLVESIKCQLNQMHMRGSVIMDDGSYQLKRHIASFNNT
ncbi:hypothetical protein HDU76_007364 [Blyttiomyces sp. JEL0837]|nr:hypothetical protein HDU76_007364 [Blyttiomyces sp. JEL0837]